MAAWEAELKWGGSSDVHEQAVASLPLSASQRSPPSVQKATVLKLTTVQFMNGLMPSTGFSTENKSRVVWYINIYIFINIDHGSH